MKKKFVFTDKQPHLKVSVLACFRARHIDQKQFHLEIDVFPQNCNER